MRSIFIFFLLIPLMVASCSDPVSDVGLNLLGSEANPQAATASVTSFSPSTLIDVTGSAPRVLVGAVDDPLTGQISAHGYLDFDGDFSGAPSDEITGAQLKLFRNYNFGDTLTAVQFELHQILENWDHAGRRANTGLKMGPAIISMTTKNILTTIDLPDTWIDENATILRSADFETEFHGFALIERGSEQVIGFTSATTVLEVTSSSGLTTYNVSSTHTQIARTRPSDTPSGFVLFQDGAGPSIEFNFAFDDFANQPIHGIELVFNVDTVATKSAPVNFVRPLARTLQLIAIPMNDADPAALVGQATLENGQYRFLERDVSVFFQRVFFGAQEYSRLELRAPIVNHSLNAVLFYDANAQDLSPQATIILSP